MPTDIPRPWPHPDIDPAEVPADLLDWAPHYSTPALRDALDQHALQVRRATADCPGICWQIAPGDVARDTECPIHGVDADPAWWRTPHLHDDRPDHTLPPPDYSACERATIGGLRP